MDDWIGLPDSHTKDHYSQWKKNDMSDRAAEEDIREKLMPFRCCFYCTETASARMWKSQGIFGKSGFATDTFYHTLTLRSLT